MKNFLLSAALACWMVLMCLIVCRANSGQDQAVAVGTKMTALMKEHRYQDAVNLGLGGLAHDRRDDLIYFWIAESYKYWTEEDPSRKPELFKLATDYAQKSISVDPKDYVTHVEDAGVLEEIGDHDDVNRCSDYKSAKAVLETDLTTLPSDIFKNGNYDAPSAPLRREMLSLQSEITSKMTQANCK